MFPCRILKGKSVLALVLCFSLLQVTAGCSSAHSDAEFAAFQSDINRSRVSDTCWTEDEQAQVEALTQSFDSVDYDWSEPLNHPGHGHGTRRIPLTKLQEDVTLLFDLLESCYSGYDYFGGDDAYHAVEDEIHNELTRFVSPRFRNAQVSVSSAEETIFASLNALITDAHFQIGTRSMVEGKKQSMYYVPGLYVNEEQVPEAMRGYLQPTIASDGSLALWFASLCVDATALPGSVLLDGVETELNWQQSMPLEKSFGNTVFQRTTRSGICVLRLHTLAQSEQALNQLNMFADSGSAYRHEPLMVLDLRGNTGGNSQFSQAWLSGYLNRQPTEQTIWCQKCSPLWLRTLEPLLDNPAVQATYDSIKENLGSWTIHTSNQEQIENSNQIFVLVDQRTASAAEDFLAQLRALPNITIVGSNTSGSDMFTNVASFYLPNSGIRVQMGTQLTLHDDLQNQEGIGIAPDLWVEPSQAEDAVISLCCYYGLK